MEANKEISALKQENSQHKIMIDELKQNQTDLSVELRLMMDRSTNATFTTYANQKVCGCQKEIADIHKQFEADLKKLNKSNTHILSEVVGIKYNASSLQTGQTILIQNVSEIMQKSSDINDQYSKLNSTFQRMIGLELTLKNNTATITEVRTDIISCGNLQRKYFAELYSRIANVTATTQKQQDQLRKQIGAVSSLQYSMTTATQQLSGK